MYNFSMNVYMTLETFSLTVRQLPISPTDAPAFPSISRTGIPCFSEGSGLGFLGDVDAFGVLANCLKWLAGLLSWHSDCSKSAQHFLRKVQGMWTLFVSDIP